MLQFGLLRWQLRHGDKLCRGSDGFLGPITSVFCLQLSAPFLFNVSFLTLMTKNTNKGIFVVGLRHSQPNGSPRTLCSYYFSLELPDPGPHAPGKLALNLTLHHHIKPGQAIVSRSYLYYLVCRRKQCLALTLWLSPVSETCLPECVGKLFVSPSAWTNFLNYD